MKRLKANRLSHLAHGSEFPTPAQKRSYAEFEKRFNDENMNTTKHTPGPWVHYNCGAGGRIHKWRVMSEKRRPICQCNSVDDGDRFNAALIAAAPDLLAALVECRAIMAAQCLSTDKMAALADVRARAAIQKATGAA